MPAAQRLNGGVFDTCCCGSGGCPNSKTVAGVLVLLQAQGIQDVPYVSNKPLFGQCLMRRIHEEWPWPITSNFYVLQDGRDRTEGRVHTTHDYIGSCTHLITFGYLQVELDHLGIGVAIDGHISPC